MPQKGSRAHTPPVSGFVTHSLLRQAGILPFPAALSKTTQVPLIFVLLQGVFSSFLSAGIFDSAHTAAVAAFSTLLEWASFALMFDPSYSSEGELVPSIFELKTFQYLV